MNYPVSRHPGAETMAAFLEGKLTPGEVAEVAAHLSECADCRTVTGAAARFEQEEDARLRKPRVFGGWKGWTAAAAAAIGAMTATFPLWRPATAIASLIDASPSEYRRVDGRLSDFPWARLQGSPRGPAEAQAENDLKSAAYKVLGEKTHDDAVKARHAAGVAHLLIYQNAESLVELTRAAGGSKDPSVWNDLAAAQLTVAVREERTDLLPSALAAADRAIQLDSGLTEAYFNRALILEKLGALDSARKAWSRYLEIDPSSEWSTEAREHLHALGDSSTDLDFRKQLARAAGNRDAILALVRRFRQDARLAGEAWLLSEWADAYVANDAARAEAKLADIRAIAGELASAKGERLLSDALTALDRGDPRAVAEAVRIYSAAGAAVRKRQVTAAEDGFRRAAAAFRAAKNPLANAADYYAAQCAFDNNRPAESTEALLALQARIDPGAYRALAAQIDMMLARNYSAAADWGSAAQVSARALAIFTDLGETANAARMNAAEAIALERMGYADKAWTLRANALAQIKGDPRRVATILASGAVALAAADRTDAAGSILDVAIETLGTEDHEVRADELIDRARLAERAGDPIAARRWLGEARTAIDLLDPSLREARVAQLDLAEAVIRRASDPNSAIAALDGSIAFHERQKRGIRLPDAYLQRARAYRAIGRTDAALADYRSVLRSIDEQQAKAGPASLGIEAFDVAAQAVDETVDLHLERGEIAHAFAVADRAHAMESSAYRTAAIPEGTAVLEYVVMPQSLAVFCVTRDGIAAARVPIGRVALTARVEAFVSKLQQHDDVTADAKALYSLLIAPAASKIAGARELVIVPDRQLSMVPFAALHDEARYLIEKYAVWMAPSAAAVTDGRAEARPTLSAAIIADPASDLAPQLQWSRREAESIAAIHGGARVLAGAEATRARVTEAIRSSAIVHYAGHADSNAQVYGALLLASDGNDSGLLSTADIGRLHLQTRPLVVLAACGTMRGDATHVAGTPSLARAFLGAGARAVIGTLWEVDDDVALPLFLRFHERLRDGEVPAAALRAAQLAMLQSSEPREHHPSAWSAVEVLTNL